MTDDGVCIVTQPERTGTGKSHVKDLADIIAEITSVVILTANLDESSPLRDAHDVEVYSAEGTGSSVVIEVIRFVLNQIRLCWAIRRRPEGIILFFGTTSYVLPVLVARLGGKRVAILPRGDVPLSLKLRWQRVMPTFLAGILAGLVSMLERINYRFATAIVTYTPSMAAELGLERYESKLFTNGARYVDTEQFDVSTPFDERELVVGYIGRFDVEKRLPVLVEVAKDLAGDIEFRFVGDGDYRDTLEEELADEIEAGDVSVTGWVDRATLPAQYNELRLLIVPSSPTEGLPTVILESMACGTPVYATPVAGVPDVVVAGENGFLLEDDSVENIEANLRRILREEDLSMMSDAARDRIVANYSFEGAVSRYQELLAQV